MVFILTMINKDLVWVWWITIDGFSLNIVELELLVIVYSWNDWTTSNHMFVKRGVLLESFESVCFVHHVVINVRVEIGVVLETLMPSQPWVIEMVVHLGSSHDFFHGTEIGWQNHVSI